MRILTIGFTRKSAEEFFTTLRDAKIKRVVDVRLNNTSQLAAFSKRDDLAYFLQRLIGVGYLHLPELAPTQDILDAYKKKRIAWKQYEEAFLALLQERCVHENVSSEALDGGCLLCSEDSPAHCHRRLVAEYLQDRWGDVEIVHL